MSRKLILLCFTMMFLLTTFMAWFSGQQRSLFIDVGEYFFAPFLENFHDKEVSTADTGAFTFQWSRDVSSIALPQATVQEVWLLRLRLHQRSSAAPKRSTLSIGSNEIEIPPQSGTRVYHFLASNTNTLIIQSDLSNISALQNIDDRNLSQKGVAIDFLNGDLIYSNHFPKIDIIVFAMMISLFVVMVIFYLNLSILDGTVVVLGFTAFLCMLIYRYFDFFALTINNTSIIAGLLIISSFFINKILLKIVGENSKFITGSILVWLLFGFTGILYPNYTPTDIFFHIHRLQDTLVGNLFMVASGQGQTYPYPPGIYIVAMPLLLIFSDLKWYLQSVGLFMGVLAPVIISIFLYRQKYPPEIIRLHFLIYIIMPAGFLLNAQSPLAQNVGGFFSLCYFTYLLYSVSKDDEERDVHLDTPRRNRVLILILLAFMTTVGHFGVFLNTFLMIVLLFLTNPKYVIKYKIYFSSWPIALIINFVLYYSTYIPLFLEQTEHLTADNPDPSLRWFLIRRYVYDLGMFDHYRFVYVLFAILLTFRLPSPIIQPAFG